MPWLLFPEGKSSQYPLNRRLGGPLSWSGCSGKEKNSWLLAGMKPPTLIVQSITVI